MRRALVHPYRWQLGRNVPCLCPRGGVSVMTLEVLTWLIAIPLLGFITGMRTLTPITVLCWFAWLKLLPVDDWAWWSAKLAVVILFTALATLEYVADKYSRMPRPTRPVVLIIRCLLRRAGRRDRRLFAGRSGNRGCDSGGSGFARGSLRGLPAPASAHPSHRLQDMARDRKRGHLRHRLHHPLYGHRHRLMDANATIVEAYPEGIRQA